MTPSVALLVLGLYGLLVCRHLSRHADLDTDLDLVLAVVSWSTAFGEHA